MLLISFLYYSIEGLSDVPPHIVNQIIQELHRLVIIKTNIGD